MSESRLILGDMRKDARITRFDGAVLADALFLIGQAWVKLAAGDLRGGDEALAAARELVPPDTIEAITHMIDAGTLPEPGPDPAAMDAWLEQCRLAGAGDWTLTRIMFPSARELRQEEHEAFLARLAGIRAQAAARQAAGEPADVPHPETGRELARPGGLAAELRAMGLM
jgi:hypothetical protein